MHTQSGSHEMSELHAIVLAAGHGKRMKSTLPKVMHPVAGRPLVHYPIAAALNAGAQCAIVVVGHERERVMPYLARAFGGRVQIAIQHEQNGTGHATAQALPVLPPTATRVLILCGDTPLLSSHDLHALAGALDNNPNAPLAMLTCIVEDPTGYGRMIRDNTGRIVEIREHRDLENDEQRAIREVNPGVYCARLDFLRKALGEIDSNNAQGEFYLTDIVALAVKSGGTVDVSADARTLLGVNDRAQLAEAETVMQARISYRLRQSGVTLRDGAVIHDTVTISPDATIENGATLRGTTTVGAGAIVDVGCVVEDSFVGDGAVLRPYTVVTCSRIEAGAKVGPFAHVGMESSIGERVQIGNFVETKKTILHRDAKANHLAYLGDAEIGDGASVGAGTIFCNDDGYQKHRTKIGAGAFIGSNCKLVAPVEVGRDAYVATGTTVTQDVPDEALAIGRSRQENKEEYAPKLRSRLKAAARLKSEA